MKLKIIESPKSDVQIAGLALSSILTDGNMKSVMGGANPCTSIRLRNCTVVLCTIEHQTPCSINTFYVCSPLVKI